jgi:hypothetical protein
MKYIFITLPLAILLLAASGSTAWHFSPPQSASTKQEKIDALNNAYKNGLLTRAEYDAKLRAISAEGAPAPAHAPAEEPPQDFGPTRTVSIIDPMFGMVAYTMDIPANWNFEGVVLQGPGCQKQYTSVVYRAYSPDMRYGIQLIPQTEFYWADDPRTLPKFGNCKYFPPMSAAEFAQFVSLRMRPNAEIDSVSPETGEEEWQANLEKNQFHFFNQTGIQGERKRVHLRFDMDGQPEEEILSTTIVVRRLNVMTNVSHTAMVQYRKLPQYYSTAFVTSFHAPNGQLASHFAAMSAIAKHWHLDEQYKQTSDAYFQNQTNMAIAASWASFNTLMQASQQQYAIMNQNAQNFIQNMQAQGQARHEQFMARMDAQDRHTRDVTDWILNQQLYQNPGTGQKFTASNQYRNTYQDQYGNVMQSNTITDPNVLYHADWTSATPIHH